MTDLEDRVKELERQMTVVMTELAAFKMRDVEDEIRAHRLNAEEAAERFGNWFRRFRPS